ncbi:MAG: DUF5686 and carboxypeptidase regulatory-like domain-containing protein [Paludibacteraceae bacterium]|nr:DUF5686 and carboxypeptidase regulatory-like domain-containing protein [Paludibacteraceae bacterium]
MKRSLVIVYAMLMMVSIAAQNTTIVGEIYDSQSGEPLPNVSVYIPGTQVGTTTTAEGVFLLRCDLVRSARVTVSSIGYKTTHFRIEPGQSAGIDIPLQEKNTQLEEVFVMPGENMALPLLERVRKNNANIDGASGHSDKENGVTETNVYLSDIEAKHLKRHLWKSLQAGMIAQSDSTYLLPLYRQKTVNGVKESQAVMMAETDYEILLSGMDETVDFYKNIIPIYNTSFLSPLAGDGNTFYRYYLVDSVATAQGKTYQVDFKTRNPYYKTFDGRMWIDSTSATLVAIEASVPRQVSANYLHQMRIEQHFDSLSHGVRSEHRSMLLDFAIKSDSSHFFPTVLIEHRKEMRHEKQETRKEIQETQNENEDSLMMAKVEDSPIMRTARFFAYVIQNAYIPTGTKVEIGNVSEIIHVNDQERVRLGLPLRTAPSLWKNVCLEAYAAYGIGDHAWKGMGMVHWNMPTLRRNMLRLRYADEYVYSEVSDFDRLMRENAVWSPQMGITTAMMKGLYKGRYTYNSAVRNREIRLDWESDWTDHLETQTRVSIGRMGYGEPSRNYNAQPSFRYGKLSAMFRLSWNEKKVDLYCRRVHIYNHLPVLYIGGEIGSVRKDGEEGEHVYGKLNVMLRHHQPLGAGGQLDYLIEAGIILGAVPFPMLNIFDGNQSYAYDPYRFTLMHNYQYAADRYVLMHVDWNGGGCLFNLIPGIRVLRLRELVSFKMAYGGLSSKHNELLTFPDGRLNNLTTPYVEIGVGIGNILRIADLMSVWRLTHRDDPGAPNWSMRFRFHIDS